jgi:four helix bundle protein
MAENRYKVKTLKRYNGTLARSAPQESKPFQTFENLEAYQVAREFRKAMYSVSRRLPDFEKFELKSQIRRAAVSLTNNISEGHGRYHYPDQIRFLLQARGSLEELIDDLNVCLDERYLPAAEIEAIKLLGWRTLNVINGYGRYLRQKRAATQNSTLRDASPEDFLNAEGDFFKDVPL